LQLCEMTKSKCSNLLKLYTFLAHFKSGSFYFQLKVESCVGAGVAIS